MGVSDAKGQLTLQSVVKSPLISNSSVLSCMTSLPNDDSDKKFAPDWFAGLRDIDV